MNNEEKQKTALEQFGRDLTALAKQGRLDPVIGRNTEIRRVIEVLSRRTKNNPVLIGEPGVGKTAIAEGLALRIVNQDVPQVLWDKKLIALDLMAMLAGAAFRGSFEARMIALIKEVSKSNGQIILFIDEMHNLSGAGGGMDGSMDAGQMLKPALARGELRAIGATTLEEYRNFIEKDKALERRFQMVMVLEPDIPSAITILRGLKEKYEVYHGVRIKDSALVAAVKLSHRYISNRFLPDKAIDLIDEAASRLNMEIGSVPIEIDEIQRKVTHLQVEQKALKKEKDKQTAKRLIEIEKELKELETVYSRLKSRWDSEKEKIANLKQIRQEIDKTRSDLEKAEREGQLDKVAELKYGILPALQKKLQDLESVKAKTGKKPQPDTNSSSETEHASGNLLNEEVGPEEIAAVLSRWTGIPVGRMLESESHKLMDMKATLTKQIIGQDEAVTVVSDAIRRSRAGISDPNRPIGSFIFLGPTGVGKTETVQVLADFLFNSRQAVIRIDMGEYVEKHQVARLIGSPPGYVGYKDGGQLTEAVRRKPYSVILFDEIEKAHPEIFHLLLPVLDEGRLTDSQGRTVDFKNTVIIMTSNIGASLAEDFIDQKIHTTKESHKKQVKIMEELNKYFRPEFLNRIDEVVLFNRLKPEHISKIVNLQLQEVEQRMKEKDIHLKWNKKAADWLANKGFDNQFGARPLKRLIQKELLNPMADKLLSKELQDGDSILLNANDLKLEFQIKKER